MFFQFELLFLLGLVWLCYICVSGKILTYLDPKHLSLGLTRPGVRIRSSPRTGIGPRLGSIQDRSRICKTN